MGSVEILRALGNKYNAEILGSADEPLSAQELSDELDVPIATCYRRINELTEAGLLEHHDSVLSDEHRRVDVYRRNVNGVQVTFEGEEFDVTVEERTNVKNKLDDVWRTLSEG
jgi:DNA-binding Lrp family transcriptional regulator